ncbi:MAG: hypothetical protein A2Y63_01495 [Candidatus Riflebacteria bacterium RBG_13_59_9]|nr:MAG: hypothetical protein A2Y63_01495 [Candidatus Riflebacteria bacterium RBG_13_59_9]
MDERSFEVAAITGPTASGKTELVLALAERIPLEVLSCDSRKVFREADIGAAKPTKAQRERVPFHLLDLVEPTESFSVQQYVSAAYPLVQQVRKRGNLPLIEGGSGLYLEALMRGYDFRCAPPVPELRRAIAEAWHCRGEAFIAALQSAFPGVTGQIDTHNLPRIVRFIEHKVAGELSVKEAREALGRLGMSQATGAVKEARLCAVRVSGAGSPLRSRGYTLVVERSTLAKRIAARTEQMLASGLIEEVEALLARGVCPDAQLFSGIGYREVLLFLQGEVPREDLAELISLRTRRFAKRQDTWDRNRFPDFQSLPFTTPDERQKARELLARELGEPAES